MSMMNGKDWKRYVFAVGIVERGEGRRRKWSEGRRRRRAATLFSPTHDGLCIPRFPARAHGTGAELPEQKEDVCSLA